MSNWSEREQRVGVGADAVERDVAEVEEAAPADDDVEAEGEQHVEHGVERDPADVAALRSRPGAARSAQRRRASSQAHQGTPRSRASSAPSAPGRGDAPLGGARDPLVLPDRRSRLVSGLAQGALRGRFGVCSLTSTHTFLMSGRPRRPWGRKSMNTIRIENTTRSDQRVVTYALRVRLGEAEDETAAPSRPESSRCPPITAAVKPFEADEEAHRRRTSGARSANEHARGAGERRPEHEREHDHAVDVDPHHRRCLAIVGRRTHRLAHPRPVDEQPEDDHQHEGRDDDDDPEQRARRRVPMSKPLKKSAAVRRARRCRSRAARRRTGAASSRRGRTRRRAR